MVTFQCVNCGHEFLVSPTAAVEGECFCPRCGHIGQRAVGRATVESWCAKHWAVVRNDKTINWVAASILLMQRMINDEKFMSDARGGDNRRTTEAEIQAHMRKVGPICCYLGEEVIKALYEEARTGA